MHNEKVEDPPEMPSEWQRARTNSGFSVHATLHQGKVKNPKLKKLKRKVVTMFFIFLQEVKNNAEL